LGEKWKRERDARVAEAQKRLASPYASYEWQQEMIHKVKAPAIKAILTIIDPSSSKAEKAGALLKGYRAAKSLGQFPEPTKENTWNPNTHRLINTRDEFFRHCHLDEKRRKVLRLGINFIIIMYDHDPPYRMMIDWWAKQLKVQNWECDIPYKLVGYNWPWWDGPEGQADTPII